MLRFLDIWIYSEKKSPGENGKLKVFYVYLIMDINHINHGSSLQQLGKYSEWKHEDTKDCAMLVVKLNVSLMSRMLAAFRKMF